MFRAMLLLTQKGEIFIQCLIRRKKWVIISPLISRLRFDIRLVWARVESLGDVIRLKMCVLDFSHFYRALPV